MFIQNTLMAAKVTYIQDRPVKLDNQFTTLTKHAEKLKLINH
jgi:hypothetical protein